MVGVPSSESVTENIVQKENMDSVKESEDSCKESIDSPAESPEECPKSSTNDEDCPESESNESKEVPDTPEARLLAAVSSNNYQQMTSVLSSGQVNVNCVDENGMSPLSHACFKGNAAIAEFLLDRGANVNQNEHEYRYTALMFAALGGHTDCVRILLDHGADSSMKNSVGRNAAQMAGFVGQHRPVAAINNHVRLEMIEYYAKLNGLETEPKLPHRLCSPVHQLVQLVNVHPVRIFIFLLSNRCLLDDQALKRVTTVLDLLSERLFKNSESQEMLSLKVHCISFMLRYVHKQRQTALDNPADHSEEDASWNGIIEKCIKFILKPNASDFQENLERFLRDAIRNYPIAENTVFVQLVRSLSTVQIGEEPTCMTILQQTIGGKTEDGLVCATCAQFDPKKRCSKCKSSNYCNESCQKYHWFVHKRQCSKL